ncbi:MAG: hypothetical protein AAF488_19950 [Planctomycetota bacterium]
MLTKLRDIVATLWKLHTQRPQPQEVPEVIPVAARPRLRRRR